MGIVTSLEPCLIASGTSLSAMIHLHVHRLFAIQMSAGWDAAALTFQGSYDGTTFANLYDDSGNEVTVQAAAGRFIVFDPSKYLGLQRVKVRSGTSGTPVLQTADRTLELILVA